MRGKQTRQATSAAKQAQGEKGLRRVKTMQIGWKGSPIKQGPSNCV